MIIGNRENYFFKCEIFYTPGFFQEMVIFRFLKEIQYFQNFVIVNPQGQENDTMKYQIAQSIRNPEVGNWIP